MENAINKQFKMNQGAHAENNTVSSFRNPEGVAQAGGTSLNMGHPMNYGTPSPVPKHEPGHGRKEGESKEDYGTRVYEAAMERERKRKEAAKKGTNKKSGRAGDFSFGPIRGNVNRYGEGG